MPGSLDLLKGPQEELQQWTLKMECIRLHTLTEQGMPTFPATEHDPLPCACSQLPVTQPAHLQLSQPQQLQPPAPPPPQKQQQHGPLWWRRPLAQLQQWGVPHGPHPGLAC